MKLKLCSVDMNPGSDYSSGSPSATINLGVVFEGTYDEWREIKEELDEMVFCRNGFRIEREETPSQ